MHNKMKCACTHTHTHTHRAREKPHIKGVSWMVHPSVSSSSPQNLWKCALIWGKKKRSVSADIITLRISRCDHPGLSSCATNPTISVTRERRRSQTEKKSHVKTEARPEWCSHKPRNARSHEKLQDAGRNFLRAFGGNLFLDSNFWAPQPQENKFLLF